MENRQSSMRKEIGHRNLMSLNSTIEHWNANGTTLIPLVCCVCLSQSGARLVAKLQQVFVRERLNVN